MAGQFSDNSGATSGGGGGGGTVTSVSGTANQIDVATGTTTPVVSLDPAITLPGSLTAPTGGSVTFSGTGTVNANVLNGQTVPTLAASTGYLYDSAGTLSLSTSASNFTTGTLPVGQIPTAIPIGSVGSSGLSGTSPVTISAAGAIGCATCTTSAASLTSNAVVIGGGGQAESTISADTTTTHALFATAGAPAFRAVATGDLPNIPLNQIISPTGAVSTFALGTNITTFNCATASAVGCMTFGETTAATTTGAVETQISTLTTSAAIGLQLTQGANGPAGANAPAIINVSAAAAGGLAAASSNGSVGAPIVLLTGAGSAGGATSGNGGNGGGFSLTLGAGGASTNGGGAGGTGGAFSVTTGAGGAPNGGGAFNPGGAATFTMGIPASLATSGSQAAIGQFSVVGSGTPASTSQATGQNIGTLFSVQGVTGGASSNAAGTGGSGSIVKFFAGNGGAGTGTNANGGAAGTLNLGQSGFGTGGAATGTGTGGSGAGINISTGTGGAGGSSGTSGAGGNVTVTLGSAGATGTIGAPGQLAVAAGTVGGAQTTPFVNLTGTWNTTGLVTGAIFANITNTASGASSKLMDLQVGSASKLNVDVNGLVTAANIIQSTVGTQIISGADYTNSTVTPSTVFSWTLPATSAAKTYRYTCDIMWESTNTTLVGPVFGVNISAAPTQLTAAAAVQNTLAGADINGYLSNATTGSQTLVTGTAAGVTNTNYWAKIWGTIEGAAVAGSTFIINAAATSGSTATLNIRRGSGCSLN
jgi:hypothetical protein